MKSKVITYIIIFMNIFCIETASFGKDIFEFRIGGATSSKYTTSPEDKGKGSFGVVGEYRKELVKNLQLGLGIGYEKHGRLKGYTDIEVPQLKVNVGETKLYDSIPLYLTARYILSDEYAVHPYIRANIGYSFNINNKNSNHYKTYNKSDGQLLDSGYLKKFDVKNGMYYSLGIGLEYRNIVFDIGYGMNSAKGKSVNYIGEKDNGKCNYKAYLFSIGYRFKFNDNRLPYFIRDDSIKEKYKNKQIKESKKSKEKEIKESKEKIKEKRNIDKRQKNNISINENMKNEILKEELPKEQRDFWKGDPNQMLDVEQGISDTGDNNIPKFFINKIQLKDEDLLLGDAEKYKIICKYENKKLSVNDIKNLGKELNNEYIKNGFVTTRVMFEPNQNINSGELDLVALSGRIQEVILDNDTRRDRRKVYFAFPKKIGDILNIHEIDQGIDNLNRLESNNAKMDIVSGDALGFSKLLVNTNKTKKYRINLGYDNTEYKKSRIKTGLQLDDLIGINDSLIFNYTGDTDRFKKEKKTKDITDNYCLQYSFPIKNWELSLTSSYDKSKNMQEGATSMYEYITKTYDQSIGLKRLLVRNSDMKLNLSFGLGVKTSSSYIEKIKLESQDRNFAVANVGINGIWKILGGMASYDLTYYKGIDGMGSKNDGRFVIGVLSEDKIDQSDSRYQFDKIESTLSWYRHFNIGKHGFTFRTTAVGQYSDDPLFSHEKISIGKHNTIRGFCDSTSGDMGYYTRTEISYIFPKISESENINRTMYKIRPFLAYDQGKVRNNYDHMGKKGGEIINLSGYTAGVRYYGDRINIDGGVTRGDKGISGIRKEKHKGYLSVTLTL